MNKGKKFNGERLQSARIYRGYNVSELAEKLSLQRQTVSMYENGKIGTPDFDILNKISQVLDFPIAFFIQQDNSNLKYGSTYFRALYTTDNKYRKQQIQRVKFISQIYKFLNEYLGFPELNLPESDVLRNCSNAEEAAVKLREHWNLGEKPIDNIIYLVEQNGIIVVDFETKTGEVDAFSQEIHDNDNDIYTYLIGYSKNKSTAARIHFDIAHELGHILMHEWSEDIESLSKESFKEKEEEAHSFASAFLLPEESFRKDIGAYANKLMYYIELKKKWKVSISAMIRRSYNLNLIDYSTYGQLMRNMHKNGIKKDEPLDNVLVTAFPSLLQAAVNMLINQNILTPQEIINELSDEYSLSLYSTEIENLLSLRKDTLKIINEKPYHEFKIIRYKNEQ